MTADKTKTKTKERARYGSNTTTIKGKLYASMYVKDANGKRKRLYKKVENQTEANQWISEQLGKIANNGGVLKIDPKTTIADLANWYKKNFLIAPVIDRDNVKVRGVKGWKGQRAKLDMICRYFGALPLATSDADELIEEQKNFSTRFSGGRLISKIDDLTLELFVQYRIEEDKVKTATTNRDLALMRAMFIAGKSKHQLLVLPKFPIQAAGEIKRERILTAGEEQALLAQCVDSETITITRKGKEYQQTIQAKRARLLPRLIIAIDTALRANEIKTLEWSDVNLERRIINIRFFNAKTQKERAVPISDRLKDELEKMPLRTGLVFRGGYKRAFATACKRAKITGLRFHDLRHTSTTRFVEAGVPQTIAMNITGHTQTSTFKRYVNSTDATIDDARESLKVYNATRQQQIIDVQQTSEAIN
jgi:integrase